MPEINSTVSDANDPVRESFQYQLDILKVELEIIDRAISRLDDITQTTKNWAILVWSGSIAVVLGQPDLRCYIAFTAIIPILFWTIDARWRYFLRGFIFREDKIAEFLNSNQLVESFKQRKLLGLKFLDPRGMQYRKTDEYKYTVNFWRSMKYPEVYIIYIGMFLMSIVVGLFFLSSP